MDVSVAAPRCGARRTSTEPRRTNRSIFRQTVDVLGASFLPAVETTTVSDSGNTTVVLVVTGVLVLFGAALAALGVWYWRSTVPDPDSLGPLHSMSERSYGELDEVEKRRRLDVMRPSLAHEMSASRPREKALVPEVDEPETDASVTVEPETVRAQRVEPDPQPSSYDDWEDEQWPGDDWSELDGWDEPRPAEPVVDHDDEIDRVDEPEFEPEVFEPEPPRRSSIDPLIG